MSGPDLGHPRDLAGQFLLSRMADAMPEGMAGAQTHALGGWKLHVTDPLPVRPIQTADGRDLGLMLGRPVDLDTGAFLDGPLILPAPPEQAGTDFDAWVEAHIYQLGGSFAFLLICGEIARFYLDACGTLSALWEPETGRVAATAPMLIPAAQMASRFRADLYERLNVASEGWFPGTLSAFDGVVRLLPNHYLDLHRQDITRHWPIAPIPETSTDTAIAALNRAAAATIAAACRAGTVSVGLTAGTETRFLTALMRPHLGKALFVTLRAAGADRDIWAAAELARRFDLPHRYLPIITGDGADVSDWQARASFGLGGMLGRSRQSIRPLRARDYFIGGQAGEVGRGFFWRKGDRAGTPIDAAGLEARLGMPADAAVRATLEAWLSGLPEAIRQDSLGLLDLAYIELRMASWAFALSYCDPEPVDIFPMISRSAFVAMMSLPADIRADNEAMIRLCIAQSWPELLDLPFNAYGDWRDRALLIRRALGNPALVLKKLRKKFG